MRGVGLGGRGIEQKGKGLMDMDNSVLIAGGEGGIKRLHGKGKCTIILLNTETVGKVLE